MSNIQNVLYVKLSLYDKNAADSRINCIHLFTVNVVINDDAITQ
jgi:hypothetical protein